MRREAAADALVALVARFGRALRDAGLPVDAARSADAVAALAAAGCDSVAGAYWPLRIAFVSRREDVGVFDRLFARLLAGEEEEEPPAPSPPEAVREVAAGAGGPEGEADGEPAPGWSPEEVLRSTDFAALDADELARVAAAIEALAAARPRRRTRRTRGAPRGGPLDARRTVRAALRTGGDALRPAFRRRVEGPRRLVLLCDVSGSMEPYARPALLLAHALLRSGRAVEVFAFGTRLTRLTAELSARDADECLARAAARVADWAGGTRIGASLEAFNDTWGRRGLSSGAAVVIVSDGWERESAAAVAREMRRLWLRAHTVVWVNPLKGSPDYQPLAGGMRAALPWVDRFLAGNDLNALAQLASALDRLERRHAAWRTLGAA
ncbi:MAG TPA: VWA domain-containing protein [Gaiellaceae bacterium]|nr:VWA domain-containing protein [Gaiellaceae bacterium]